MALHKPYRDIPGTVIFDADQARAGYQLNQFCMSLMQADNRARFKADQRAYLDQWPMTETQKQSVLARDYNAMMAEGGNIYFLAKIFSSDGLSFQHAAASMTGMSQQDYAAMMLQGGRRPEGTGKTAESEGKAGAPPRTVGGMDADPERTGTYSQRVLGGAPAFPTRSIGDKDHG